MKAKDEALKIEKDFQKFFKVKYEFRNAVEKAMIEFAKAKCKEQRIKCSWAYKEKCDKYSWGKAKFYSPVFDFISNAKTPDFE